MVDPQAVRAVLEDLRAEGEALDALVAPLGARGWEADTPAEGWTVAHQVAHLAWTDGRALLAVLDPDRFTGELGGDLAELAASVDTGAAAGAAEPYPELLARWREGRTRLLDALAAAPPDARFPWYGPPMSTASVATGRLMETWAHGEDVADTFRVRREPTARLRHVVRIAVRARDYAFAVHGMAPPAEPFRVELVAPDGSSWTYGPPDAAQRVTGPALDFCLLAVRRRHRDDTAVRARGADADRWLSVAQAFAGPPGKPRAAANGGAA
ncbi:TIGR03084 family metal-binding protein [Actinacidiphila reveromycinica]|uniref:TIGR03084 family metal-binding protein n=1 Tax=Actinacidiphila reveromycinica TaxID=659352 RepID=UPI001920B6E3|nr:TIGR03084 family metal-binding protein [Streptomyces sp. SN-593]